MRKAWICDNLVLRNRHPGISQPHKLASEMSPSRHSPETHTASQTGSTKWASDEWLRSNRPLHPVDVGTHPPPAPRPVWAQHQKWGRGVWENENHSCLWTRHKHSVSRTNPVITDCESCNHAQERKDYLHFKSILKFTILVKGENF